VLIVVDGEAEEPFNRGVGFKELEVYRLMADGSWVGAEVCLV
jgi:hypothetical protein